MAIQCNGCKFVLPGLDSLHLVKTCPECGNTNRDQFFRVDDEDIDPVQHAKDREWLEAQRLDE